MSKKILILLCRSMKIIELILCIGIVDLIFQFICKLVFSFVKTLIKVGLKRQTGRAVLFGSKIKLK